jgi:hypothetical protein
MPVSTIISFTKIPDNAQQAAASRTATTPPTVFPVGLMLPIAITIPAYMAPVRSAATFWMAAVMALVAAPG